MKLASMNTRLTLTVAMAIVLHLCACGGRGAPVVTQDCAIRIECPDEASVGSELPLVFYIDNLSDTVNPSARLSFDVYVNGKLLQKSTGHKMPLEKTSTLVKIGSKYTSTDKGDVEIKAVLNVRDNAASNNTAVKRVKFR